MKKGILDLLKDRKVKITNERREIISVLEKAKYPVSPANVYRRIDTKLPKVHLTTIYRSLEMFERLGLVKRTIFNTTNFSYEIVVGRPHHHHVICKQCEKIEDLENISEKFIEEVSKKTKFRIENHTLEFFGLCESCLKGTH
jgi:Fur family ferric uptake transcriptional regulator